MEVIRAIELLNKNIECAKNLPEWQKNNEEIEMMEMAKIAMEKQIPKEVNHFMDDDTFETTCCGIDVTNEDYKYCPECGQLFGEVVEVEEIED